MIYESVRSNEVMIRAWYDVLQGRQLDIVRACTGHATATLRVELCRRAREPQRQPLLSGIRAGAGAHSPDKEAVQRMGRHPCLTSSVTTNAFLPGSLSVAWRDGLLNARSCGTFATNLVLVRLFIMLRSPV